MKIKATTHLEISHARKGTFKCFVTRDFDTESEEMWPVALAEGELRSVARVWIAGEAIPCRSNLVRSWKIIGASPAEQGEPSEAHTEPVLTRESVLSGRLYSVLEQHSDGYWWYHAGATYENPNDARTKMLTYTDRAALIISHTNGILRETPIAYTLDCYHFRSNDGGEFSLTGGVIVDTNEREPIHRIDFIRQAQA